MSYRIVLDDARFTQDTETELARLISDIESDPTVPLTVHFHGGLVSQAGGERVADGLTPVYEPASRALFFIWRSGMLEVAPRIIDDVLLQIAKDVIFSRLLRHVLRFAESKINAGGSTRADGAVLSMAAVEKELAHSVEAEPFRGIVPADDVLSRLAAVDDLNDLQSALESDDLLNEKLAAIAGSIKDDTELTRSRAADPTSFVPMSSETLLSDDVLREIRDEPSDGTRSIALGLKLAKIAFGILVDVVKRFAQGRDHGLYCTVVEELLRRLYVDKIGTIAWEEMKVDTSQAFERKPGHGGAALLQALAELGAKGKMPSRILLVGHSTGAIWIANLLKTARSVVPSARFDVVFLAPAVTCKDWADALDAAEGAISGFRMFAMSDQNESADHMVPTVYTRSLLYFVSGILEHETDKPIVGMQRFLRGGDPLAGLEGVQRVRAFLAAGADRAFFSPAAVGPGKETTSEHHGDFDDVDWRTVASLRHITRHGF